MNRAEEFHMEQLRIPPHSIEAEQAVLGALLLVNRCWDEVEGLVDDLDFYRRDHQLIFRAIGELAEKSKPFDAVTLGEWFESQGQIEQVAGGAYLVELATTTPSAANVVAYAEIVREKSRMRRVIGVGTDLVNQGFHPEGRTSVEIIGAAQTSIGDLLHDEPCDLEDVNPIMKRVMDNLQKRWESDSQIHGLPTGIPDLDEVIDGLHPGDLLILAARPAMGKTTLAQNIAEHVAITSRKAVAIFSFEMQKEQLGDRMLSSVGGINGTRIRTGQLEDEDWSKVTSAIRLLKDAPISIAPPRSARVAHVVAQIRRRHSRQPLGLVVIDYLQLLETPGKKTTSDEFGEVTRALKLCAGELGVPLVVLSQLNRDCEKRPDKRPIIADLRSSGSIEQDADVIVFIYRDEVYHKGSPDKGAAELIVAKQRGGATGTVRVRYRPWLFKFDDIANWDPPSAADPEEEPSTARRFRSGSRGKDAAAGRDR